MGWSNGTGFNADGSIHYGGMNYAWGGISAMATNAWNATSENGFSHSTYRNGRLTSRRLYSEFVYRGDGNGNGTILSNDYIAYSFENGGSGKFIPNENLFRRLSTPNNLIAGTGGSGDPRFVGFTYNQELMLGDALSNMELAVLLWLAPNTKFAKIGRTVNPRTRPRNGE